MTSMLKKVEINGVDVSDYISTFRYQRQISNAIGSTKLVLGTAVESVLTLDNNQTVQIWRGWNTSTDEKIFSGNIEKWEKQGGRIDITAKDKLWQLVRRNVNYSYDSNTDASAGKLSEIFKDLVTVWGKLTADATSVQDSGTEVTIKRFVCSRSDVFAECNRLAKYLKWQFYYDSSTDKVYFEPEGYTNNSIVIDYNYMVEVPKWRFDMTELINRVDVIGAEQLVGHTFTFAGNGSQTEFNIVNKDSTLVKPASIAVTLDTIIQKGGLEDSTTDPEYTVDKEEKTFTFTTAPSNSASGTATITYAVPTPVRVRNQTSIDKYDLSEKTIILTDIKNVVDAEEVAKAEIKKYSVPFVSTMLKLQNLQTGSFDVGQTVAVHDSKNNMTRSVTINKYEINYPQNFDKAYVGDKEWRTGDFEASVMEKLHRIEEQLTENQDVLLQLFESAPNINMVPWGRALIQQDVDSTALIWGHPTYGIWGTGKWSASSVTGPQRVKFCSGALYDMAGYDMVHYDSRIEEADS